MWNLYVDRHERLEHDLSMIISTLSNAKASLRQITEDIVDETTTHKNIR